MLLVLRSWRLSCWSWRLGLVEKGVLEVEAGSDAETCSSRLRLGILIEGQAVEVWRLVEVAVVEQVVLMVVYQARQEEFMKIKKRWKLHVEMERGSEMHA